MKKIVLTYGLISGAIIAALMFATMPFFTGEGANMQYGMLVGYTTMAIAFSLIYFAIRKFRDTEGGGSITFGRAFLIGLLISLITSVFYAMAWEVCYKTFASGFLEQYSNAMINHAVESGKSEAEIAQMEKEMQEFSATYQNFIARFFITMIEIFPVGLLVSLTCAAILRRSKK